MIKNKKSVKAKSQAPVFPSSVLKPVNDFLTAKLHMLEKRKKEITKDDPFSDRSRVDDNAATDIEADEQFGHARSSAINKEITKSIINIRKVLTSIKLGKYGICEDCGQMIDTERLMTLPESIYCKKCAAKREK